MSSTRKLLSSLRGPLLVVAALAVSGVVLAAIASDSLRQREADATPAPATPMFVETGTATARDGYTVTRRYLGRIEAARRTALGFEEGGLIAEVLVGEGDLVAKGDVLARLDTDRLEDERAVLEAGLEVASANEERARLEFERARDLVQGDVVSQQQFDDAREGYRASLARRNEVQRQLALVETRIDKARLRAPFPGMVAGRLADEGRVVAAGTPVIDLVEEAPREARIGISGDLAATLQPGSVHTIQVEGTPQQARLFSLLPVRDSATRTVTALFRLDGDSTTFREGDYAEILLADPIPTPVVQVPYTALQGNSLGYWEVLVLEPAAEQGVFTLNRRAVTLEHVDGEVAFVTGDLSGGEEIVAAGLQRVLAGTLVRKAAP